MVTDEMAINLGNYMKKQGFSCELIADCLLAVVGIERAIMISGQQAAIERAAQN